jgi:hypothetical protein
VRVRPLYQRPTCTLNFSNTSFCSTLAGEPKMYRGVQQLPPNFQDLCRTAQVPQPGMIPVVGAPGRGIGAVRPGKPLVACARLCSPMLCPPPYTRPTHARLLPSCNFFQGAD